MLDLAFVRGNLSAVEEKLRARNMDPAVVLGEFTAIDSRRRQAITEVETLKAQAEMEPLKLRFHLEAGMVCNSPITSDQY